MSILETIASRKAELTQLSNRTIELKNDIAELEEWWERHRLRNYVTCICPGNYGDRNCEECIFFDRCEYRFKSDYSKLDGAIFKATKRK